LGGNTDVVLAQLKLHEQALLKNISVIPDCGLAPGLGNTLAAYALEQFDQAKQIRVRCGGLAQTPKGPLDYKLVFSIRGLTNEYFGKAWVIRNSKRIEIDTFTEKETVTFDAPVGECEAFVTTGGSSTVPWSFLGKVENFDYKTVRYKGHFEKMKCMLDLGLLDLTPVKVKAADGAWVEVAPRELFHQVIPSRISFPEDKDLVVLRVTAEGIKNGASHKVQYDLLDFQCEKTGFTAMERSTSYPAAQVLIHAVKGLSKKGVLALELALDNKRYLRDLDQSDLKIRGIES
jgi:lysine 6-dehydrogenase